MGRREAEGIGFSAQKQKHSFLSANLKTISFGSERSFRSLSQMMQRQSLTGVTYHGEYQQQGDPSREDLDGEHDVGELNNREELCNLVVFHPSSNNCHTGEFVAANNNNNNNTVQVVITCLGYFDVNISLKQRN